MKEWIVANLDYIGCAAFGALFGLFVAWFVRYAP